MERYWNVAKTVMGSLLNSAASKTVESVANSTSELGREALNATASKLPPLPPVLLFNGHDFELYLAYLMLGVMAVLPIYFGSWASVQALQTKVERQKNRTKDEEDEDDESEYFSLEDAKWFPLIGSATLLSLYLLFKFFNREYLNYLITAYFSILGVGALTKALLAVIRKVTGAKLLGDYRLELFRQGHEILSTHFSHTHLVLASLSTLLSVYYAISKHWIVANLYGLAFATTAIQLLNLDSFLTGIILLSGLFFYDVFWVFGTDVMVTVAKSFDAPIKVVWPKDLVTVIAHKGLWEALSVTKNMQYTMLGLGDIVIPGIFVALCLRFDYSNFGKRVKGTTLSFSRVAHPYFAVNFALYALGLLTTVVVMHNFKAAQPALLYLSPACIMGALLVAYFKGQLGELFSYKEGPKEASAVSSVADSSASKPQKKKSKAPVAKKQTPQVEPNPVKVDSKLAEESTPAPKSRKKSKANKQADGKGASNAESARSPAAANVNASLRITGTPGKKGAVPSKSIAQPSMFEALSQLDDNNKPRK